MKLQEIAYKRSDAIEKCYTYGKPFIEYFHTCMRDLLNNNKELYYLHASKMQACWDAVKDIKLTSNNKKLLCDQLINWFFTVGSGVEDVIDADYQEIYERFYIELLKDRYAKLVVVLEYIFFEIS